MNEMIGVRIELVEGIDEALCLDYANTVSERPTGKPVDSAPGYEALLEWFVKKELLEKEARNELLSLRRTSPESVVSFVRHAHAFREALYAVFSNLAAGKKTSGQIFAVVASEVGAGVGQLILEPNPDGAILRRNGGAPTPETLLAPIALSAAALLTSENASRVRECANHACGWLFLDHSKNRTRKWCDMADCGNKMKARRHYARVKARKAEGTPGSLIGKRG